MLEVRDELEEAHRLYWQLTLDILVSLNHRCIDVGQRARAAARSSEVLISLLLDISASWLLAHELTLRSWAQSRLLALPVALGLLAHGSARCLGCRARSSALGRSAHSLALGAVLSLAQILRAADIALRLIAVNLA